MNADHRSVWAIAIAAALSQAGVASMPYAFGAFVSSYGLTLSTTGFIGFIETLAFAVTMIGLASRIEAFSARRLLSFGALLLALSQGATFLAHSAVSLSMARACAGVASGILLSASTAAAARCADAALAFAASTAAMTIGIALGSFAFPWIESRVGIAGVFASIGVGSLLCLPIYAFVPGIHYKAAARPGETLSPVRVGIGKGRAVAIVVGMILFATGTTGIWAYCERLGARIGLSADQVGLGLGIASLIGAFGSVVARWLARWRYQAISAAIGPAICGGSVLILTSTTSSAAFSITLVAYVLSWWLAYTFVLTLAGRIDATGRVSTLAAGAYMLSTALGTGLTGWIADEFGFPGIGAGTLIACVIAAAVIGSCAKHVARVPLASRS